MGNHIGIQIKCHNHPQRRRESPAVSLAKLAHGSNQTGGRETFPWPRIPPIFSLGSNSVILIHPKINGLSGRERGLWDRALRLFMYSVVTCLLHSNSDGSDFLDGVFQHLITHPASSSANTDVFLSSWKHRAWGIILKTLFWCFLSLHLHQVLHKDYLCGISFPLHS